jgi:hypothetical protein
MFGNHRLLKVAWLRFVLAGILFAAPAVKAQSSREKSAASYFARGIEWQARGEFDRSIADFGIAIRRPRPKPISRSVSRSNRR